MNKLSLTTARVADLQCAPDRQQTIFWDNMTPGLGVRATVAGAKSYIFETRLFGKTLRMTIGDTRTWTLGQARTEATKYKALTDQGIDPRQQLAAERTRVEAEQAASKRKLITLGDVWPVYIAARKPRWGERTYLDHVKLADRGGQPQKKSDRKTISAPLASLLDAPLSELDASRITRWLEAEQATRPTSTSLSYRMLRAFMRWAEDIDEYRGIVPTGAYSARSVREATPKVKAKVGDCLQREQLRPWFSAVQKIVSPTIRTYLQALLLTGARREELASLRWGDVDFQWRSLTIRDKVEGSRDIPLTPYVARLLMSLRHKDAPTSDTEWVFRSSRSRDGRLAEPRIAHVQALAQAGLPHLTLHGLRRSFGTLCEWVDVPSGVSAQIMGHKPSALAEKHYRRRPLDMLRLHHERIECWILNEAGIQALPNDVAALSTAPEVASSAKFIEAA